MDPDADNCRRRGPVAGGRPDRGTRDLPPAYLEATGTRGARFRLARASVLYLLRGAPHSHRRRIAPAAVGATCTRERRRHRSLALAKVVRLSSRLTFTPRGVGSSSPSNSGD